MLGSLTWGGSLGFLRLSTCREVTSFFQVLVASGHSRMAPGEEICVLSARNQFGVFGPRRPAITYIVRLFSLIYTIFVGHCWVRVLVF